MNCGLEHRLNNDARPIVGEVLRDVFWPNVFKKRIFF
jgi:hypothetical protein